MAEHIQLADTEWRLMQFIWDNVPCTFRQLCDAACAPNGWTKHTVMSYLKRMEAKGAIEIVDVKPKLYKPLINKDEAICRETENVLKRVYNGNVLLMVQSAARAAGELSDEEMAALRRLLERDEGGEKGE